MSTPAQPVGSQVSKSHDLASPRHSAAPFSDVRTDSVARIFDRDGFPIALCFYTGSVSTTMANAALFTAAPRLLSACQRALQLLEGVAKQELEAGKRNAAMNVREVEVALQQAVLLAGGVA